MSIRNLPWIMSAMWLIARFIAGKFLSIENARNFGVLSNVLLILILIFLTIYFKYRGIQGERPTFLADLKDCMKSAMKYVFGASLGIGLYYGVLSNDIQTIRETRTAMFNEEIKSDENFNKIRNDHPELKDKSREELSQMNSDNVQRYVSVHMQVLGGLLVLTFVSFAYSLLAVITWRSVVRRL